MVRSIFCTELILMYGVMLEHVLFIFSQLKTELSHNHLLKNLLIFPMELPGHHCWKSVDYKCGSISRLNFVSLIHMFILIPSE